MREGFWYGLGAYVWWGLVPFYFFWLNQSAKFPPLEFVAHRIVWSALLLGFVLTVTRRWPTARICLTTPRLILPLFASAVLVGGNWLIYVLCVDNDTIVQASLGYFILPLVNLLFGLVIFRERVRPLQCLAVAIASTGVVSIGIAIGTTPWLALGLAASFSLYGLIRKQVPVDGLIGLAIETFVLLPIVLVYLAIVYLHRMEIEEPLLLFKLSMSGIVTAVPLLCFGQAARRLPFAMLGFMQYISPSLQFLLALVLFDETVVGGWHNFGIVWIALLIFSFDSYLWFRQREPRVV